MMEILFVIECFLASTAKCDSHSLEFRSFGLKEEAGDHINVTVGQQVLFDGVAASYCCEGRTRSDILFQGWRSSDIVRDIVASYDQIHHLTNMPVDVLQRQRGCVRSTDGTVSAFERWAVSGVDFITFDPHSLRWTSRSPWADAVERSWNKEQTRNRLFSYFLRSQCPSMLQQMKLKPTDGIDVRIFAKAIPGTTAKVSLRCHVTSRDRSLKVSLSGDGGAPTVNRVRVTGPLPTGEDGAVVFRLTAEVLSSHDGTYVCAVQTRSHNNVSVLWDGLTLDGRRIRMDAGDKGHLWTILMFFGIGISVVIVSGFWCFIKIVRVRHGHPPLFDKNPSLPEEHQQLHKSFHTMDMNMDTEETQEGEDEEDVIIVMKPFSTVGSQPKTMRLYEETQGGEEDVMELFSTFGNQPKTMRLYG